MTENLPTEVSNNVSWFDRFAESASRFVSKAWFFAFSVIIVLIWLPSGLLIGFGDTWQLIINTTTTILTFLLVALLQNAQERGSKAQQQKLNAIVAGVYDLMQHADLSDKKSAQELKAAIGIEEKEST